MKKFHELRKAHIDELKLNRDDILDYLDEHYRDKTVMKYHRCPEPWSKYAVRPDGRCMDLYDGREFDPLPGGKRQKYPNFTMAKDGKDRTETVTVHRVLAKTFLENNTGLSFDQCQVDHRNSNKSDYNLDNLTIVTPERNKALAYIKNERVDNFNTRVEDVETEEIIDFYSQAAASRFLGVSNQWLSYRFKSRDLIEIYPFRVWKITRQEYLLAEQAVMSV